MFKIQESAITTSGQVQVTLPEGFKILLAATIGGTSMIRSFVDTANPNTTATLNVVASGSNVGGDFTQQQWLGYIVLSGTTYDVFMAF
jgi:hypothetical protein